MGEVNFGNLDGRQLCLRFTARSFQPFDGKKFRFQWRALFRLTNWRWTLFSRGSWGLSWRYQRDATHRCYCDSGLMFDGWLAIAGLGVTWFYSRFTGDVPCPCDQAVAEMEAADAAKGA